MRVGLKVIGAFKNDNVRNIEFPMRLVLMISSLFLVILMVFLKRGEESVN